MGHERVGTLPKSKKWAQVVDSIGGVYADEVPVGALAAQTLQNVRKQYESLFRDDAVKTAFGFLVKLAHSLRSENPQETLNSLGITMGERVTLLSIVRTLKEQLPNNQAASEYGQITIGAAADAIGQWYQQNNTEQLSLFGPSGGLIDTLRPLGEGAGFCELSRLFFGKITERYLNYFLERAASAVCPSLDHRQNLESGIRSHVEDVSKHAFESAKITQSFAAGWFNKNAREKVPTERQLEGFLSIAFGKMREELRREEAKP